MLLTLGLGMPVEFWELAWLASGNDTAMQRATFMALYHLEIGTMVIEGSDVEAVIPVTGFESWWIELGVWLLLPPAACLAGCEQSQRPVM